MNEVSTALCRLERDGYSLISGVFTTNECANFVAILERALNSDESAVLRSRGQTYGSRDLIRLVPVVLDIPRQPVLRAFLRTLLGDSAGLVRALYFDKPPERSWSLAWHKDFTIAVERNDLPTSVFRCPTRKSGIPHVEAPESLLEKMATLRLHLDPMTSGNGPLSIIPGSHQTDSSPPSDPVEINTAAGDVLAMRPLLTHSSSFSRPGNTLHRRVIHLEFAPTRELPDGYAWHTFEPID